MKKGGNMFLKKSSLTKQISTAATLVILITMGVLTTVVTNAGGRAAIDVAQNELRQQAISIQRMLDGYFEAVSLRSERQFSTLEQWMPGPLTLGSQMVDTNGVMLPELLVAGETVNASPKLLEQFRKLTGNEIAFLVVHEGRVYRASTFLEQNGKPMYGSEISLADPVSQALLKGQDYNGLIVRSGRYYFLKTKAIRDAQGRVFGGVSLRLSLDGELAQIRALFKSLKVAETGGVSILRVGGEDNGGGEWILHPSFERKSLNDMNQNADWLAVIQGLMKEMPSVTHVQLNPATGQQIDALVSTAKSEPWGWLAIVSAPKNEFLIQSISTRNLVIFSGVLASLICAVVLYWLLRARLRPLSDVVSVLSLVGEGDLSARVQAIDEKSQNEIDLIGCAVNKSTLHMCALIRGVESACEEILGSSEALEAQAKVAKECSDQQLQASVHMSSGVEEMHATVSQVAQNASEAARASDQVRQETSRGKSMVSGTVSDMGSIAQQVEHSAQVVVSLGENSQQILNIVKVIREVADRTNLLALNAAIEAARAGEFGRGFAVVADEVRQLAEQTNRSTQEISSTVDSILGQTGLAVEKMSSVRQGVSDGVTRAQQAGLALDEIDRQIESSSSLASDIAHSTSEQKIVTERFADTVLRIHELAQRNHGASESTGQAAREMIDLSARLKSALQKFKTA